MTSRPRLRVRGAGPVLPEPIHGSRTRVYSPTDDLMMSAMTSAFFSNSKTVVLLYDWAGGAWNRHLQRTCEGFVPLKKK